MLKGGMVTAHEHRQAWGRVRGVMEGETCVIQRWAARKEG